MSVQKPHSSALVLLAIQPQGLHRWPFSALGRHSLYEKSPFISMRRGRQLRLPIERWTYEKSVVNPTHLVLRRLPTPNGITVLPASSILPVGLAHSSPRRIGLVDPRLQRPLKLAVEVCNSRVSKNCARSIVNICPMSSSKKCIRSVPRLPSVSSLPPSLSGFLHPYMILTGSATCAVKENRSCPPWYFVSDTRLHAAPTVDC